MEEYSDPTKALVLRVGAKQDALNDLMKQMGARLPDEYVKFMLSSDGAEGPIGDRGYLRLWSVPEIRELNEGYNVGEFAPGLLLFGGDGGDVGYAFDTRHDNMPIASVQLSDMSLESAKPLALTFGEFLKTLAST